MQVTLVPLPIYRLNSPFTAPSRNAVHSFGVKLRTGPPPVLGVPDQDLVTVAGTHLDTGPLVGAELGLDPLHLDAGVRVTCRRPGPLVHHHGRQTI